MFDIGRAANAVSITKTAPIRVLRRTNPFELEVPLRQKCFLKHFHTPASSKIALRVTRDALLRVTQLLVDVDLRMFDAPFSIALLQVSCHPAGTDGDAIHVNTPGRPRLAESCFER